MAKRIDHTSMEDWRIMHSDEFKTYLAALCRLASKYVSRIRVKFAERAFEKYADPTIRKLVLAYGEEAKKLDDRRLFDFSMAAEHGALTEDSLEDSCLNNAKGYAKAIWFLFGIDDKEDSHGKND